MHIIIIRFIAFNNVHVYSSLVSILNWHENMCSYSPMDWPHVFPFIHTCIGISLLYVYKVLGMKIYVLILKWIGHTFFHSYIHLT